MFTQGDFPYFEISDIRLQELATPEPEGYLWLRGSAVIKNLFMVLFLAGMCYISFVATILLRHVFYKYIYHLPDVIRGAFPVSVIELHCYCVTC